MNRRDFLNLSAASLCGLTSHSLYAGANTSSNISKAGKTLVLVELKGGNDGLNTVIPYTDPAYFQLRPNIHIKRDKVIPLNEKLGFHPALKPLFPCWKRSDCAVTLGVGYPKPNRSHFRSIEIWESASNSSEVLQSGWLNSVLTQSPNTDRILDGVVLGLDAGPLRGNQLRTISMKQKIRTFNAKQSSQQRMSPALQHVLEVQELLDQSSRYFKKNLKPLAKAQHFPKHRFGQDMMLAAQIIASGSNIPVIKTSIGSFDTHTSQQKTHHRLLQQLAQGVEAMEKSMKHYNIWDNVIIMTYSEFGRRVSENGSKGTDHGTAAPHFAFGGSVKGGLYGLQPSLNNLENQDLKYHIDFRQMYSSLEKNWWGIKGKNSQQFKAIDFI